MTADIVQVERKIKTLRDLMENMSGEIAKVAPKHLTADRIIRVATTSLRKTPKLADCTPKSFLECLLTCTQCGLAPDSAAQHAHLIPYGNICTLIFGYRGLMDLALRHPDVASFHVPQVVHEKDAYEYTEGQHPTLTHKPWIGGDRGEIVAFYVVATLANGECPFKWMSLEDVIKVRDKVKDWQKKPWKTDFPAMGLKTAVRRLCKWLPATPELQMAVTIDEQAEAGLPQSVLKLEAELPPPAPTTDALREELTKKPEPEPDNAKLQEVQDRKGKSQGKAEPTDSVDLQSRRKAIKDAWIGIPVDKRPDILASLTPNTVATLVHVDEIEGIDDEADLIMIQEVFVNASEKF